MVQVIFHLLFLVCALCQLVGSQELRPVKPEMKESILKEHNDIRSSVANGTFKEKGGKTMESARKMLTMVWDAKMQKNAEDSAVASKCKMGDPRNPDVGENQFAVSSNSSITDVDKLYIEAIRAWLKEFKESPWDTEYKTKSELIHAIQCVWARTRKIGCALATCNGGKEAIVICDYFPKGNLANKWAYQPGPMCSFCKPRKMNNKKKYKKMAKRMMRKCKKTSLCK